MPIKVVQSSAAQTDASVVAAVASMKIKFRVIHFSVGSGVAANPEASMADIHEETSGTKYAVTHGSYNPYPQVWRQTDTANKALQVTSLAGSSLEIEFEYV